MPPREVTLSKGPANPAPLIIKNDSEANQKKSQETFKKNPEADAYVKKLIENRVFFGLSRGNKPLKYSASVLQ